MLSLVDIAALLVIGLGVVTGRMRRFSGELARLVGTVAAFAAGMALRRPLGLWLLEHTRLEAQAAQAAAFVAALVGAFLVLAMVHRLLQGVMRVVIEEQMDKSIGMLAGLVRATLFVIIVFLVMNMVPHPGLNRHFGDASFLGRMVRRWTPFLEEAVRENAQDWPGIAVMEQDGATDL